ncbi:MAG: type II toxin-antitoxin system ParD family antitoxin [Sulfitobacter sp.]
MGTRNVVLTDSNEDFINALVQSGRYQNASEALRAGLRLLEAEETGLQALRDHLSESIAQAERGEVAEGTGEEVIRRAFARARARYAAKCAS